MNEGNYILNECQKNKFLVWLIDQLMIKSVREIIKITIFHTYISNMSFGWLLEGIKIIDTITMQNKWTVVRSFD